MIHTTIRLVIPVFLIILVVGASHGMAQETGGGFDRTFAQNDVEAAPVIIDGTTIFQLRGATAFPASERAALVSNRIESIAADPSFDPDTIKIASNPMGQEISIGKRLIVTLVDADAELAGLKLPLLSEFTRDRIRETIETYRTERSHGVLITRAIYAAAALALGILAAIGTVFAAKWLYRAIDHRYKQRKDELRIQSLPLIRAEQIHSALAIVIRVLQWAIIATLAFVAIDYALEQFPWTRPIAMHMGFFLADPLLSIAMGILRSIPDLVYIAIVVVLTRFLLRLTLMLFKGIERGAIRIANFDRDWAIPTYKAVRLLIIVLAVVVAYPYIPGSQSEAFKGISILMGVILSLGSSSSISNIIAGYTMIYRRAFREGDWIQIGQTVGEVMDRRLLVTELRSPKNEAVILPNSQIINTEIVNFSALARANGLILHTTVSIGYDVPWQRVEAMLIGAAARVEGLKAQPPPFVLEKSLDNFAVTYELNAYCNDPSRIFELYAELHRSIMDVFKESEVEIMTPDVLAFRGETASPPRARSSRARSKPLKKVKAASEPMRVQEGD